MQADRETFNQRISEIEEEKRQLAVALEEEQSASAQIQVGWTQLLGEFSSSVLAAEAAAEMLSGMEELAASVEGKVVSLVPCIASILTKPAATLQDDSRADQGSEQLKIVELEMELEERNKAAEDAQEENARLSAAVEQLHLEKEDLENKVNILMVISR